MPTARTVEKGRPTLGLLVLGCGLGLVLLVLATSISTSWIVYFMLAGGAALAFPWAVARLGSPERAALIGFVVALPCEVDFNPIFRPTTYPAGVNGMSVSLLVLAALAWTVVWRWRRAEGTVAPWSFDRSLVRASAAFLIWPALSVVHVIDKHQWAYGMFLNASAVFIAMVACQAVASGGEKELRLIWVLLIGTLVFESVIVGIQNILGFTFTLKGQIIDRFGARGDWSAGGRYSGTFTVPSVTGTYIAFTLFFTMMGTLSKRLMPSRLLTGPAFGLGILALLLTLTRSAWLGYIGGSFLLSIWLVRRGYLKPRTIGLALLAMLVAAAIAWPAVAHRLAEDHEGDAQVRWNLALIAVKIIEAHPLVGVGLNSSYFLVRDYIPQDWAGHWVFVVHNQFLLMAQETGIPGMLALVWLFAVGLHAALVSRRSPDPLIKEAGAAMFVTLVSLVWALNLDFVQGSQSYLHVFFMIGLAVGLKRLAERSRPLEARPPAPGQRQR